MNFLLAVLEQIYERIYHRAWMNKVQCQGGQRIAGKATAVQQAAAPALKVLSTVQ